MSSWLPPQAKPAKDKAEPEKSRAQPCRFHKVPELTQGAQCGLIIKEDGLNYVGIPSMIEGMFLHEAILGSLGT